MMVNIVFSFELPLCMLYKRSFGESLDYSIDNIGPQALLLKAL